MKALSIKQPWLWCILNKLKDIEIRTWNTTYRGEIYLHTGKTIDEDGYNHLKNTLNIQMPLINLLETGKILGKANLINTIHYDDMEKFSNDKHRHLNSQTWWNNKLYGFILSDIEIVEEKTCNGKLGIFDVDE